MHNAHRSQKRTLDTLDLELWKVESHCVGASNWTQVFCKEHQMLLSTEKSLQRPLFYFLDSFYWLFLLTYVAYGHVQQMYGDQRQLWGVSSLLPWWGHSDGSQVIRPAWQALVPAEPFYCSGLISFECWIIFIAIVLETTDCPHTDGHLSCFHIRAMIKYLWASGEDIGYR